MDLSKLPKLSNTTSEQPPPDSGRMPPPLAVPAPQPTISAGEAWLSIGVGVFLLLFQPRMIQWISSRIFHTHFDEYTDQTNTVVPYPSIVPDFWSDLGVTLFALVLIADGLLLFARRRWGIWVAFGMTSITTLYNLIFVFGSFSKYGFAPISFLAVIFGGFIASVQWRIIKTNSA